MTELDMKVYLSQKRRIQLAEKEPNQKQEEPNSKEFKDFWYSLGAAAMLIGESEVELDAEIIAGALANYFLDTAYIDSILITTTARPVSVDGSRVIELPPWAIKVCPGKSDNQETRFHITIGPADPLR